VSRKTSPSVSRIRRTGIRVSGGPWTVYIANAEQPTGRLVVALRRTAGCAVTRSRTRRIARDVFQPLRDTGAGVDIFLMARDDLQAQSRRNLRITLQELLGRGVKALAQRGPSQGEMGG
jgi:ribonuclease P protein component